MSTTWQSSPNPEWKIGQRLVENETEIGRSWLEAVQGCDFKSLNPDEIDSSSTYRLMASGIVPRPIAFVSTLSESGQANLAPFSFFQMVGEDPPLVMISLSTLRSPQVHDKNTAENVKRTKEFTINVVSDAFVEAVNWTSIVMPLNEWPGSGLTQLPSTVVRPARVAEAAVSFECQLHSFTDFDSVKNPGERSTTLVIGLVKRLHVRTDVLNEKGDAIDPFKLRPVLRMGSGGYGRFLEGYILPRPDWNKAQEEVEAFYSSSPKS